jgi:hypothetical protein
MKSLGFFSSFPKGLEITQETVRHFECNGDFATIEDAVGVS